MSKNTPNPDDLAGRYRIVSRLGAGGMGVAYRAWDEQEGRPVVIKIPKKVFLEDPKFAERFAREIRLLQGLRHPHIVPIVDVGEHDGLPYVVMRFLPGGSLSNRRLRDENGKTRPNPPGMLHLWLPAVADALDHVHANGVVHRDVKPANIFFDAYWNAFLGDFGIAKIIEETGAFEREHTLTATSMGPGTPDYMAPELFYSKTLVNGRIDQYSLAVIAYEMLAGNRPFTGDPPQVYIAVATQPPPRLERQVRGLPASLVDAVHRGLAKAPGERFTTCREFAYHALRDVPLLADEPDIARLLCPKCSNILKLPVAAAGQKGKCPKCQTQMKVADDLGALWLLDEARRQRRSQASVVDIQDIEVDEESAETNSELDEQALEAFEPVSSTTPIERATRKPAKKVSTGMILGGVTVAVVALAGLLMVFGGGSGGGGKKLPPTYEQQLAQAEERVGRKSDHKTANDFLGRHWCFRQEDWKKGLPYLAKSGAIGLWNTAQKELNLEAANPPAGPGDRVRLAKEWWTLAGQKAFVAAEEATAIKKHATGIYTASVAGLTDGKDVELANKWLDGDREFQELVDNKRPPEVASTQVVQQELPAEAITTTVSSVYEPRQAVRHLVDGSGMSEDRHDNDGGAFTMWHTVYDPKSTTPAPGVSESPAWVRFDFATPQSISRVCIWNHNQMNLTDRGFRTARLWTTGDGNTWASRPIEIPRAKGGPNAPLSLEVTLAGSPIKSLVLSAESNYGSNCYGLSEVKFYTPRPVLFRGTQSASLIYLSELKENSSKVIHFGFGKGTINGPQNPIRSIIDGQPSPHGLSMHPGDGPEGGCFVKYTLPNGAARFTAIATLNQSGSFDHCGIGFEVLADGKSVWKSKPINRDHKSEVCDIEIPGCKELELRTFTVTAAFGGHAVWIEPQVLLGNNPSGRPSAGTAKPAGGPPSDAKVWEKNGQAYKVFKEKLLWPQAKQRCEELGGHLVSITSPEERQFVHSVIEESGIAVDNSQGLDSWREKLWAGGTDEGSEGNWRWVDGSPWAFAAWLPQQPDNDGNYLNICPHRGGGWNDEHATGPLVTGFICEWPKQTPNPDPKAPPQTDSKQVSVWLADLPVKSRKSHFFHARMSWESIGGKRYANTIHIHPEVGSGQSQLVFEIDGKYEELSGAIGVLDMAKRIASQQIFRIIGDGKELWKSAPFKKTGKGEDFRVDVSGVKTLELHADSTGPRFDAHCVWIEPRLASGASKENPKNADNSTQAP